MHCIDQSHQSTVCNLYSTVMKNIPKYLNVLLLAPLPFSASLKHVITSKDNQGFLKILLNEVKVLSK